MTMLENIVIVQKHVTAPRDESDRIIEEPQFPTEAGSVLRRVPSERAFVYDVKGMR